jgi:hypothetical protein
MLNFKSLGRAIIFSGALCEISDFHGLFRAIKSRVENLQTILISNP